METEAHIILGSAKYLQANRLLMGIEYFSSSSETRRTSKIQDFYAEKIILGRSVEHLTCVHSVIKICTSLKLNKIMYISYSVQLLVLGHELLVA